MRAVKIWGNSGFVTPLGYSNGHYPRHDQWLLGDDDCTNYHTLPGITFQNHVDAKKILEIVRKAVSLFGGERLESFIHTNLLRNQFKSDLHFKFLVDTIVIGFGRMHFKDYIPNISQLLREKGSKVFDDKTIETLKNNTNDPLLKLVTPHTLPTLIFCNLSLCFSLTRKVCLPVITHSEEFPLSSFTFRYKLNVCGFSK